MGMDLQKARSWTLNVQDKFKDKTQEEIRTTLKNSALPFAVACEHWQGDFNMSTAMRNANGFNAKEFIYIGKKAWDRRGSVGCHNYFPWINFLSLEDFIEYAYSKYIIVGLDNIKNASISIEQFEWPDNTLMLFGEEGSGLTKEAIEICDHIVEIPMYGSVRSFNCGTSSGIAMYDYITKYNKRKKHV